MPAGRPPLPPDQRRTSRGVRLPAAVWERLEEVAVSLQSSHDRTLEALIERAHETLEAEGHGHV